MNAKKWSLSLIAVSLVIVMLFGMIEFWLDPLVFFRKETGPLTYRYYSEIYSNPGIARNYDYNAVLLGSSMVENTDVGEINRLFDCVTIKVPYSGGSAYNHKKILDICYGAGKRIDKVFWALDEYALSTGVDTPRYPLPEYLYDENRINGIAYLLNLDIFYFYTIKGLFGTLTGRKEPMMKGGSWIQDESVYCRENALASVKYPIPEKDSLGERYYQQELMDNLRKNILPFVEKHPETEFYFYMVPYSILYWYQTRQKGTLEAEIYNAKTAVGELLKYENVEVFFFQDDLDIITELELYKDYSHFTPEINSYMSREMNRGSHRMDRASYEQRLNDFYACLKEFDYDGFVREAADVR